MTCAVSGRAAEPQLQEQQELEELVVTANRQSAMTINRVPMSIAAQTQKGLDDLGIKNSQDLQRVVPSLRIGVNGPTGVNVSIRGIQGGNSAAATTGIYLDESPLQARALNGVATGGGSFLPILFDLERIEVLKGPQGTLYGSSSEGGTIRYLTPDPSVTDFSSYARAEVNTIQDGDAGGELGLAFGGPLVENVLGVRASVFRRRIGGWVDHVDWRDQSLIQPDTNTQDQSAVRLALLFTPIEGLKIKPSAYFAWDDKDDEDRVYTDVPAYTTPAIGTILSGTGAGTPVLANGPACPVTVLQSPTAPTCTDIFHRGLLPAGYVTPTSAGIRTDVPGYVGQDIFIHPEHTYGPINLGNYESLQNTGVGLNYTGPVSAGRSVRESAIKNYSLDMEYDAGPVLIKSITSLLRDSGVGYADLALNEVRNSTVSVGGGYTPYALSPFIFDLNSPYNSSQFYDAHRQAFTQELRFSSAPSDGRLSWIGGAYYQYASTRSHVEAAQDRNILQMALFGHPQAGINPVHTAEEIASNMQTASDQQVHENRLAFFAETNFKLTQRLTLTTGVRWSQEKLSFHQYSWGLLTAAPFTGAVPNAQGVLPPPGSPGVPVTGNVSEQPVTPKVSLAFQATDDDLFYATAAKGFRPGGVQAQATAQCANDLAQLELTSTPASFGSDSVWSYEGGAKVRLLDRRVSLAGSVFHIDWDKPQTPYLLPTCGFSYVQNIGKAVSEGFDVQADIRLLQGFTVNVSVGYTDARYTQTVETVPNAAGVRTPLVFEGQRFVGIPKWQTTLGARYDFSALGHDSYLLAAWQYTGKMPNATPPGTSGYAPDFMVTPAMNFVTARVGMVFSNLDLSLFVDNLTNEHKVIVAAASGRGACRTTDCSIFSAYYPSPYGTTFRPRTVGVSATYRF
jgi:outer membrane receptor protein involved in Fe transport